MSLTINSPFIFLKRILCRKDVSIICLLLAIGIKILLFFYFQLIDGDKIFQAMAGKNLAEGHGLTIKQVHVSNISKENYEPLVGWPPGYSVAFAVIFSVVHNVETSCIIIDIICIFLFFIILRKLLRQLDFSDYLINLLVLFNGCTITSYITLSTPTDFLTLILILYNCSLCIDLFRQKRSVSHAIKFAFFNILPAWFRYVYIPVSFVIPGVLLWNGWLKKDRKLLLYGTYAIVIALLGSIVLLSLQKPYVVPTDKGIFWSNLLYLDPVIFSAFMDVNFFLVQLNRLTGLSYTTGMQILRWLNTGPFLFLFAFLFYASSKRKWLSTNAWQLFTLLGCLLGISTFCVLAYLSVRQSAHFPPPGHGFWTYVSEDRYFVFLQFFIVVITAKWLFMPPATAFRPVKWAQGLFLFLFSISMLHSIYILAKYFTFDRRDAAETATENRMIWYIDKTIKENKKQNTDIVFAGYPNTSMWSVLMGGKGLLVPAELNEKEIRAHKPTRIIAIVDSLQLPYYKPFLNKDGVKLETRIGSFYFYSYDVKPITTLKD